MSMLVMSPRALSRMVEQPRSYYLDVRAMLADGLRGQTPFTPATGIFLQLNARLSKLTRQALDAACDHAGMLANHFREQIVGLCLQPFSRCMPNAMTALEITGAEISARSLVKLLEHNYGLLVAPNSGGLADRIFRVSHMGNLKLSDIDNLVAALAEILHQPDRGLK
jgi:aspartate aminotransferase-like enzyme